MEKIMTDEVKTEVNTVIGHPERFGIVYEVTNGDVTTYLIECMTLKTFENRPPPIPQTKQNGDVTGSLYRDTREAAVGVASEWVNGTLTLN
jgi:hypothetical protein